VSRRTSRRESSTSGKREFGGGFPLTPTLSQREREGVSPVPRLGAGACLAILLLAAGARLAAVGMAGFSTLRFGDAHAYLGAARSLVETGRYPDRTDAFFFRAPGYPAFLVAATLGNPARVHLAKLANVALGSLSALFLAVLSARLFRRRGIAIATGLAAALHPSFLFIASDVQSESLFLFLLLCSGFLLLAASDRPSSSQALLSGVFLALAALTRPSALALAPLLLAPLFDRRYPTRARAHLAFSAVLGLLLALAPWTLRNALLFREFLPVSDASGVAFYQGNSDWNVRFYEVESREHYERWMAVFDRDMREQTEALDRSGRISPSERSRYFFRKALSERLGDPGGWARLFARKSWDWLRPYPRPWFWPPWVVIGIGLLYTGLMGFAIAGLWKAERRGAVLFCLALLAITMAAHVVLSVLWRYRVPYWDPVLLLYGIFGAGITLAPLWKLRRR